jgi:transcription elongation factor Elf1
MSNIRVQAYAEKIVNKGGGMKGQKVWKTHKETINGKEEEVHYQERVEIKTTGSDYIVFNCPACSKRNNRVAYDAKVEEDGKVLVFRCNKCLTMVEVKRPIRLTTLDGGLLHLPGGNRVGDGKIVLA